MKIKSNAHQQSIFSKTWNLLKVDALWYLISGVIVGLGLITLFSTTNWGTGILLIALGIISFVILKDGSMDEFWAIPIIILAFALITSAFNTSYAERTIKVDIQNINLSESNEKMIVYFKGMRKSMAVIDMTDNSTDFYTIKSNEENNLTTIIEMTEYETKDIYDILTEGSRYKYTMKFRVYHPSLGTAHETNYEDILTTTYTKNDTYLFDKRQF